MGNLKYLALNHTGCLKNIATLKKFHISLNLHVVALKFSHYQDNSLLYQRVKFQNKICSSSTYIKTKQFHHEENISGAVDEWTENGPKSTF